MSLALSSLTSYDTTFMTGCEVFVDGGLPQV
jgi:hypothetical protein